MLKMDVGICGSIFCPFQVVLGNNAATDEKNVLEIETTGFSGETVKQPIAVVWKGHDMVNT